MIKFKLLREGAVLPKYATEGSAGLDLVFAPSNGFGTVELEPGIRAAFETGLAVAIPYGYCGVIMPRSGLAVNFGLDKMAGLIDADYRGEIKVVLINHGKDTAYIRPGERIAQMIIIPVYMTHVVEAFELTPSGRGNGGFGSTGA